MKREEELLVKMVVGSQAYGTNIATSDTDYKGVYLQPLKEVLGFSYQPQVEVTKDECYFEIKRFVELAMSANPTMLELLFAPAETIVKVDPRWQQILDVKEMFLTKNCRNSFGGYAFQQIEKAKGLNKKMNWEKNRIERKNVIDFCYITVGGRSVNLPKYLKDNDIDPKYCGMVKLDHMADCYVMYHDSVSQWGEQANHRFRTEGDEVPTLGFKGIESSDGNCLLLSSVPKYSLPVEGTIYFNKSEWAKHCTDFKSYNTWLEERNTARYVDSQEHGQKIDGKNLMHCRRLLDMAIEIATTGKLLVRRPNREELLNIRTGKVRLDEVIKKAEDDIKLLDELYAKSDLPDRVDINEANNLVFKLRGL